MAILDNLPALTGKEAYQAMLEFLRIELELSGKDGIVHLGGLLAELELEPNGESADQGGALQFADAVNRVVMQRDSRRD